MDSLGTAGDIETYPYTEGYGPWSMVIDSLIDLQQT
jgi:hypothetical protein